MRDYLFGAVVATLAISLARLAISIADGPVDFDKLPHSDWQCTDVRIDGLSLLLVPVCWEYTRKAEK